MVAQVGQQEQLAVVEDALVHALVIVIILVQVDARIVVQEHAKPALLLELALDVVLLVLQLVRVGALRIAQLDAQEVLAMLIVAEDVILHVAQIAALAVMDVLDAAELALLDVKVAQATVIILALSLAVLVTVKELAAEDVAQHVQKTVEVDAPETVQHLVVLTALGQRLNKIKGGMCLWQTQQLQRN